MMKMYHASSFALAGLVPAAAIAPGGQAAIDLALGVAMPVHSHVAMNFVRDSMRCDAMRCDGMRWDAMRCDGGRRSGDEGERGEARETRDEKRGKRSGSWMTDGE